MIGAKEAVLLDAIKTGTLIAQARKEKGMTQRELAETVYVSVQAVSKWELLSWHVPYDPGR